MLLHAAAPTGGTALCQSRTQQFYCAASESSVNLLEILVRPVVIEKIIAIIHVRNRVHFILIRLLEIN